MKVAFKTAYLQREIVLDAKPQTDVEIGHLVTFTPADGNLSKKEGTDDSAIAAGDYIIAQSDMTMEYGHAMVENRDYSYSPVVKASTDAFKKVAVFRVIDPTDIIITDTEED